MYVNKQFDDLIFNADKRIINQSDRMILRAYAHYSDMNGKSSFPSRKTVADLAKVSKTTVRRRVKHLEALGMLKCVGTSYLETKSYEINIEYLKKCQ